MKVSCIVPTFRQMPYLAYSIESVISQDYPDIELIITDDASAHFNEEQVRTFVTSRMKDNLTSFSIIRHETNVGTVRNMNDALKKCSGEIIVPLASDDIFFDSTVITRIVDRIVKEGCEIISCSRLKCSQDMKEKIRLMPHPGYYKRLNKMDTAEKQYLAMAMGKNFEYASGASLYYRASFIKKAGYYDERYRLWEDGPLLARTTRDGIKVCMAYDIVSILYRDGGISTARKEKVPSGIFTDYCNNIKFEYINYKNRFNKWEQRVLVGRSAFQINKNELTPKLCFKYPEAAFNEILIKLCKASDRFMYSVNCKCKLNTPRQIVPIN